MTRNRKKSELKEERIERFGGLVAILVGILFLIFLLVMSN